MIYKNEYLNEISFPLGGIGTGCIGLAGNGQLIDWEIFNRPDKGSYNRYSHIAVKVKKDDKTYTKVLNSDVTKELMGRYLNVKGHVGYGYGPFSETMNGFPHFKNCEFKGEFPIAELTFTDEGFPGKVILRAFNPFIPLDSKNSSIPAAFFEIVYENECDIDIEFECAFSLSNPYRDGKNVEVVNGNVTSIMLVNAEKDENDVGYGDLSISCIEPAYVQPYWYRGKWKDTVSTFWSEFAVEDNLSKRVYSEAGNCDTCSLAKSVKLKAGEKAENRFVLSWNIPNNYNYWDNNPELLKKSWKNYYATVFKNSVDSGVYSLNNWDSLYEKTKQFKDELFMTTVDESIKDAVSSIMSVLKSPTVYRLENGEFYGFEGVSEKDGSCEGTCQHVYNYAYALCFLFPELERSIRNLEFDYCTGKSGETIFRLKLPLGEKSGEFNYDNMSTHTNYSCLDGQMGCVIKTYREWKISGDNKWLESVWPTVQKILEFAWSEDNKHRWDYNKDGVLEGRQHHTLDMELFGPSSWLQGFYLAALKAGSEMADFLGYKDKSKEYLELYEKGREWTRENLFNGEYFVQKVDLKDKSIPESFDCVDEYWNEETGEIKYQIEGGSSIDQLTGQWHAVLCGLGDIFDKEQVKIALMSMYKYNFKKSMRDVTNTWRVFALNDEAGTIMCDYPEGSYKPRIPITYCEECMTGFEYAYAGLLMSEGFEKEAIDVVKAVRDRYDGKKRNPWNEMECGSNYVRAMASFALLPIMSGFTFDLPHNKIGFNPINKKDFRSIWSLGTGWGNVLVNECDVKLNIMSGNLELTQIDLPFVKNATKLIIDDKELTFELKNGSLVFEKTTVNNYMEIIYNEKQ